MEESQEFIIKMSNGEYLCMVQEDNDYVEGFTTKNWKSADHFTIEKVKEIFLAFKEGKKLSGESHGEVHPEVFELWMRNKSLQPVSYQKVISTLEEETFI